MRDGERQVAPTLEGIRRDHRARYEWAAQRLPPGSRVIDLACGVGYGALILAQAGHTVVAIDRCAEAIEYGRLHYAHPGIVWHVADAASLGALPEADAAVCFETVEHLAAPLPMLRALARAAPRLLVSVPNEDEFPFIGYRFHHRHYRQQELSALMTEAGFRPGHWFGQAGPHSSVTEQAKGRTIIVDALSIPVPERPAVPAHVAILGLGPSLETYVDVVKRLGARHKFADEVWGINAVADVIICDRVFHMDDVRVQEARAAAKPESNIAAMLGWLKRHPGPIYTSRTHPEYPGLVPYPLEDVLNSCGIGYFNSTAAYAVAFAVHLGVQKITCFGFDFTYPNAHHAERGRACVEFHLGIAKARGIEIGIPDQTTLLDGLATRQERLYGYDTLDVQTERDDSGAWRVAFEPRDAVPTAAEIEARYDHSKHPAAAMLARI